MVVWKGVVAGARRDDGLCHPQSRSFPLSRSALDFTPVIIPNHETHPAIPLRLHTGCPGRNRCHSVSIGDPLVLFPAWPKEWDVDFKLHAPRQTTVEATLKGGKLVALKVSPASREKDIIHQPGIQRAQ
jgi:hypothetical protein